MKAFWLFTLWCLLAASASADDAVNYLRDVKPILKSRCIACHGALKQKAGLRLDTGVAARRGGKKTVLVPGRAAASELVRRISADDLSERMPPIGKPLETEQIAKIRMWIEQGATSPADERPEPDPREHWAFRPPRRAALPAASDGHASDNPIDSLIDAEQRRRGVVAAGPAEPLVLLRRVYLDLVGLPPTPEELAAFVADPSPAAYAKVVDQLLARPQYGERWARHWMDIWRYSDWYGRRNLGDVRNSFLNIWHWRDWIIRSLNENHGYDRMIAEMLAGDEIVPADDDTVAATGFIVRNWYRFNYDQWMRDMVEHTGKAFLGLRFNCALCHDHKYDPISQRDYFSFRAFFEPLEVRYDRAPGGPPLPKLLRYEPGVVEAQIPLQVGRPGIEEAYPDLPTLMYRGGDSRDLMKEEPPVKPGMPPILGGKLPAIVPIDLPTKAWYPGSQEWEQREELARLDARTAAAINALSNAPDEAIVNVEQQDLVLAAARLDLEAARGERAFADARIHADSARFARAADANTLARRAAHLERAAGVALVRRDVAKSKLALLVTRLMSPTDPKTKAAVAKAESALAKAEKRLPDAQRLEQQESTDYTPLGPTYPTRSSGRRRALAGWIASRENPLTARVAVNHVWGWHFGRPLVASTYDFGRAGAEPTMPALLDWLAVEFMESGWDFKHLHRLIVTSRAYQRSSDVAPELARNFELDKSNQTAWRFERQRMEAEVLRDSMLKVAGLLDSTMGGLELENDTAATTPRRSIYFARHPEDGGTLLFTSQFDAPDVCECYRRTESLVPQQALAMANSDLTQTVARAIAITLSKQVAGERDATARHRRLVTLAFEQVLNRAPRPAERELCEAFLQRQLQLYAAGSKSAAPDSDLQAAESLIRSLLSHNDFITIH